MKEIMNPKWEDADDCEDKMPIHKNRNYKSEMKKRNMKNDKPAYYYYKHNCSSFLGSSSRKFLTYVTKTRPNLPANSRKLGNYNSTIIFEIDIMKKLSPINLNPCQTWLFHKFFDCFFCFDLQLFTLKLSWECCQSSRKEVLFGFW